MAITDLAPFSVSGKEILTLQIVDNKIYPAQYPCLILNKEEIINIFERKNFRLVEQFDSLDGFEIFFVGKKIAKYGGQIWER